MANNLRVGNNGAIGKQDITFENAGVTIQNTEIIYKVGNPYSSYDPKQTLNSLTEGFVTGGQYILVMKEAQDWRSFLITDATVEGDITPDTPTAPVVDDNADTFNWTYNPLYLSLADYEYTLDAGATYQSVTAKPIIVGDIARSAGQVGVRVKADTGRTASGTLYNTTAFTVLPPILYEDTFNASDDPDIAGRVPTTINAGSSTWTKAVGSGVLQILSNGLTGDGSTCTYHLDHSIRDVDLRYTIKSLTNPLDGLGFGLWASYCYVDENNYMLTYLISGETYKKVAGVQTQLFAGSGVAAVGDVTRIVVNGTSLKIYRNNALLADLTISGTENIGTKHGILSASVASTADKIDKFTSYEV